MSERTLRHVLEDAAIDASSTAAEYGEKLGAAHKKRSEILRAITPLLVDAVNGVFEHRKKVEGESEYLHRTDVCEACKLAIALEKAGVTCE